MSRKSFTQHPDFLEMAKIANGAVVGAAMRAGVEINASELEASVNRIVDDLTRVLLRAPKVRRVA